MFPAFLLKYKDCKKTRLTILAQFWKIQGQLSILNKNIQFTEILLP